MSHDSGQNVQARAKAAFSQIRGTLKLAGLESAVNVIRDRWGVAHTYAENQHEARE
jgi:acyl-homoserine lactone acylase PvdQ